VNYLPYLGRIHNYQKDNCLSLIAEIYEKELNISLIEERQLFQNFCFNDLKEIRRIPVQAIYNLKNWNKICLTKLQEFDIIIHVKYNKLAHFTMYAGSYKVLDLSESQKSVLKHLDDKQRTYIDGVIRHRSLVT
jgi:hypothetical protein